MFPFVDGFQWTVGHIVFLTAFGLVIAVMAVTMFVVVQRVLDNYRKNRTAAIQWHSDFHDLGEQDRRCRHELTGCTARRECHNAFECGECPEHPRFAKLEPSTVGLSLEAFGLNFPSDRLYHRGHTWVRVEEDGTMTIGLDDLGRRLLGQPDRVQLPKPGDSLTTNGAAWYAFRNDVPVRVLAPVDGMVIETGGPDQEWYLKVRPTRANPNLAHLLRGAEVSAWLRRELERLQIMVAPKGAGAALADGGSLMEDLPQAQPDANWDAAYGKIFLAP
jgi:glycine cleavage system H protein